jgi:hypothetical protein
MCLEKSLEDDEPRRSAGIEGDKHNLGYGCFKVVFAF